MNGKSKCKILKEIRKKIAQENDISYITSECKHQGDCAGTCPKCEAEVRYLEEELRKRKNVGKAIAVAGIAAAIVVTSAGCDLLFPETGGDPLPPSHNQELDGDIRLPPETTAGIIVLPEDTDPTQQEVPGGLMPETIPTDAELMGDVVPE